MKHNRVISTAVLLLLLGTTIPAFAQKGEEEKGGGKAPEAQQKAQPQRAQHAGAAAARPSDTTPGAAAARPSNTTPGAATTRPSDTTPGTAAARPSDTTPGTATTRPSDTTPGAAAARPSDNNPPGSSHRPLLTMVATTVTGAAGTRNTATGKRQHYGRISNANYSSHFGHDHSFHMGHPADERRV